MKQNNNIIKTYDKLGGWLIVLNFVFIISIFNNLLIKPTIFFYLTQSINLITTSNNILFTLSIIFIVIGNLMVFPLIFTYLLFIMKSHLFPKWYMFFRTINFSFLLIGTIISIKSNSHSISAQNITNISSLISGILSILIIFPYLIFSKRVKGTFRRKNNTIILEDNYMVNNVNCDECNELNVAKLIQIGLTECPKCGRTLIPQVFEVVSSDKANNEKIETKNEINNNKEISLFKKILKSELFIATISILIFSLLLTILAINNIIPKILIDKSKPRLFIIWLIVFSKSIINWVKIIIKKIKR